MLIYSQVVTGRSLLTFGIGIQLCPKAERPNGDVGRDSQREVPPGGFV